MKHRLHIFSLFVLPLLAALLCSASLWAVTSTMPSNYYSGADGKTGNALRLALQDIIDGHNNIGYDNLKYLMKYSDTKDADGTHVVDIYSDCEYTSGTDALSWISGGSVGDGMNREHTVPQSWFDKEAPMVGDAFHIYPTDAKSNNNRSSYLYGELDLTKTVTKYTGTSGGKTYHELGGKGTSKWSSSSNPITYTLNGKNYVTTAYYAGTIYEPDDEYKGDIARGYFYMATRYASGSGNANCSNWSGGAFGGENNGLTNYTAELMLKWHRQDPVSEKELIRNEVIYGNTTYNKGSRKQNNRNPFIDYPCLVEYIWGDSVGKNVDIAKLVSAYDASFSGQGCPCENSTDPAIVSPSNSVVVGSTESGVSVSKIITVRGVNLTSGLSFSLTGTNASSFSLSTTSMTQATALSGGSLTITYTPTSGSSHTATLVISGGGLSSSYNVTLSGTCCTPFVITFSRNGITSNTNSCDAYTLPTISDEDDACDGWAFKGWITSSSYNSTTAPTYTTSVSSAQTVYAVYGHSETSGGGGASTAASVTFNTASSDGSADISSNISSIVSDASGISSYSGTKVYAGKNGAKLGSSSATGSITLTLSSTVSVTKVTVSGSQYSSDAGKLTVTAGSTSLGSNDPGTNVEYSASSAVSTNTITVATTSKRAYISSITVTTGSGSTTTTYKTTPCTTYTISYADANGEAAHGSYWADQTSATEGTVISLDANADEGYELTGWTVTKEGGGTVTVSNDEFTMPANNVTVAATFTALSSHTVTFMNNGATYASRSGYTGSAISAVPDPTACDGYTFEGWSTNTYTTDNTDSPVIDYTGLVPAGGATYYAVYSKTEGSGSSAATAGTTLWSEDFSGYSANDVPSGSIDNDHTGTTVYSGTLTYAVANGGGTTKIYAENSAGGTSPELLIAKSNGSFSITNLPTGSAATMTLSFNSNKTSYINKLSVTSGTSGISIGSLSYSGSVVSCTITNSGSVETFDLTIAYTDSYNSREDNFLLTVTTAGSGGSTTYHTTTPACSCSRTITATSNDENMGTVGVTLP